MDYLTSRMQALGWEVVSQDEEQVEFVSTRSRRQVEFRVKDDGKLEQTKGEQLDLSGILPEEQTAITSIAKTPPTSAVVDGKAGSDWRSPVRWVAGLLAIISSLIVWPAACSYSAEASAVQITQIYAGGILAATITLSLSVGLYVITRAGD